MMRFARDLRLIPIALIASVALLILTVANLVLGDGHWLSSNGMPQDSDTVIHAATDAPQPANQKLSWAQEMFNFPSGKGQAPVTDIAPSPIQSRTSRAADAHAGGPDITGSIRAEGPPGGPKTHAPAGQAAAPAPAAQGTIIPTDGGKLPSGAERAILERLTQRREQLDSRARELDIRESLVKAAEKRIAAQLAEIKAVEARISTETKEQDKAEAARFKSLVTMYENMKPRDAAKILDGLDMSVLIKVVSQINPRTMADIMAQMSPDIAQRLTTELASRAERTAQSAPAELPKIEGRPTSK